MEYRIEEGRTVRVNTRGDKDILANFVARITHETRYIDGKTTTTYLTLAAENPEGEPYPPVELLAEDFANMSWVLPKWGVQAVIFPGDRVREDLRTAIQLSSKPEIRTIYKHTGWTTINGARAYLHAGGAITQTGNRPNVSVQLPEELSRYNLINDGDTQKGLFATLHLLDVAPRHVTWPLLAATLTPLYGPVDFAVHLTGRTGTFKSELVSLFQSHYGPMDARHLPASWSSTGNALEAQAYYAKNAALVIDDFVPSGTTWQQRAYQMTADKLIRGQGNQAGRARLSDTARLQTTMHPRGIVISTGEDTPDGHSIRARMMILELSPGDVDVAQLTKAQKMRQHYAATTQYLIQALAKEPYDPTDDADLIRQDYLDLGHTRTPSMLGRLLATTYHFIRQLQLDAVFPAATANKLSDEATDALRQAALNQVQYLEHSDPADVFTAAIRHIFAAHIAHVRTADGGIPRNPTLLGWTEDKGFGDISTYRSHGPILGWVDWARDVMYLDMTAGYAVVKKQAGNELALSKQTVLKRLKDSGILTRADEARQRNTIRIHAEGHARNVAALSLSQTLELMETAL